MGRYTGSPDTIILDQLIHLKGFSAGSFAGLCLLHLLWKFPNVVTESTLGAIACPPQLLIAPPELHTLHLFHYEADRLCVWRPARQLLENLKIDYTYVVTQDNTYHEHFGASEHNYAHWLTLAIPAGWWNISGLLFVCPAAASAARRDATPLRLLSWLSFCLAPEVDEFIEEAMKYLSTSQTVKEQELVGLGGKLLGLDPPCDTAESLRDRLIELVSVFKR